MNSKDQFKYFLSNNNGKDKKCEEDDECLIMEVKESLLRVRAATPEALAQQLINSFLHDGHFCQNGDQFPFVMLLMHQWFDTSIGLARKLINSFWKDSFCTSSCSHSDYDLCSLYQHQSKVCHAIHFWISSFPIHFDGESQLTAMIENFREEIKEDPKLSQLVQLSQIRSFAWTRIVSVQKKMEKRKVSLVLDLLEPQELANHMTFLEHKIMSRITFLDLKAYALSGKMSSPLERSIRLFNGLSHWIQFMVLKCKLPQQRAQVIHKFIQLAQCLLELNNFNSLMSVVWGLSHSSLARLHLTQSQVPSQAQKSLTQLTNLLSSNNNFANYRRCLLQTSGFRIPYLGLHLKDLISLDTALPDRVDGGLVNFRKMTQLAAIFGELWEVQKGTPPLEVNHDLVNTLKLSLDSIQSDDQIYSLSLQREPRNIQVWWQSELFALWAKDISMDTNGKHSQKQVQEVVKRIYEKYDLDGDGLLSAGDLHEKLSGQMFHLLDTDKDGKISKVDVESFFLGVNPHHFQETTYIRPTICSHCTGLLWSLKRQGFKCKDCGINTHKHCKDLVSSKCNS